MANASTIAAHRPASRLAGHRDGVDVGDRARAPQTRARAARRGGVAPGAEVELIARRALGRNAAIYIVRAGGQGMVLGVTDHMVTKLGDADMVDIDLADLVDENGSHWTAPDAGGSVPGSAWKTMLGQMRDRTVRR